MIASTIPWAPIVAFMVASPLTSPEELIYSAGLFGWPFAIAFFVSSILLGLLGGAVADFCESRGWLANQARFASSKPLPEVPAPVTTPAAGTRPADCACRPALPAISVTALVVDTGLVAFSTPRTPACGCPPDPHEDTTPVAQAVSQGEAARPKVTLRNWIDESFRTGKQLLGMFLGFAFLGYLLNGLIPQAWISAVFGGGNIYSVPLAATLGLPLYINTEGSLPLVRALIDGGMSQGAALAFLITGAGTSIGAMGGALTIARWRVIALVIGTLWVGAIVLGYAYNLLLASRLF